VVSGHILKATKQKPKVRKAMLKDGTPKHLVKLLTQRVPTLMQILLHMLKVGVLVLLEQLLTQKVHKL
jgi:hypothetical protein